MPIQSTGGLCGIVPEEAKVGPGAQEFNAYSLYVTYIKCMLYKHSVFNKTGRTLPRKGNIKPALCMGSSGYLVPATSSEPRTSSFIVTSQLDGKGIKT